MGLTLAQRAAREDIVAQLELKLTKLKKSHAAAISALPDRLDRLVCAS